MTYFMLFMTTANVIKICKYGFNPTISDLYENVNYHVEDKNVTFVISLLRDNIINFDLAETFLKPFLGNFDTP